jgi:acyl dehydratase
VAIDSSFVGRVYPPTPPYRISREKIREFATAVGDDDPAYLDPAVARSLGYSDVIAPPTFAIVVTMPAGHQVTFDPELGLDYSRVVHGEQLFTHYRPLVAGDEVSVVVHVDSIRSAGGNDILGIRAEVSTTDAEAVLTAVTTLVARGTAGPADS